LAVRCVLLVPSAFGVLLLSLAVIQPRLCRRLFGEKIGDAFADVVALYFRSLVLSERIRRKHQSLKY
jgi:hypothetical protein